MAGANQKIPITDPGIDKENDTSHITTILLGKLKDRIRWYSI